MRTFFSLLLGLSMVTVWSAACSDSNSARPPAGQGDAGDPIGPPVHAAVGPAGGTIAATGATLRIPAGALQSEVNIVLTPLAEAAPQGYSSRSPIYRFEPDGLQFRVPAEIEFAVDGHRAEDTVFWSEPDGRFTARPSTAHEGKLRANVVHFSKGFVGEQRADAGDAGIACETSPRSEVLRADAADASIVWNGQGYGVAWKDQSVLHFMRLDVQGKPIGDPISIENYGYGAKLVFNGTGYGLAYVAYDSNQNRIVQFVRLDASGQRIGTPLQVGSADVISDLDVAFQGGQYGIVWRKNQSTNTDILLLRVDAGGQKVGNQIVLRHRAEVAGSVAITASNGMYAVAWSDYRHGASNSEIYFARVNVEGATIGAEVRVTDDAKNSQLPAIAWSGSHYGIFYSQQTESGGQERFVRLDANGQRAGDDVVIANDARMDSRATRAIWTGTGYGVAFAQTDGASLHRLAADGTPTAPRMALGAGTDPLLAWGGNAYRVIWRVPTGPQSYDLRISSALCP
ncbi:hypothetical protein [Pendulispora albinea]|uniref:Uncharacterized protein n=1 Tax=Pendulispora albinea TaxID=2741071 RepID=A0ABZ2LWG6_9BACT